MTTEDLEKLKKDHDYCIIPIKNILEINSNELGQQRIVVKPDVDSGIFMQFVNSDYFRTWGKGIHFEENNIKPVSLYNPSIKIDELRDGVMKEIDSIFKGFYAKLEKAEKDMRTKK